ncbi:MAG: ribonuclease HI [Flavobacteriales bacterium]
MDKVIVHTDGACSGNPGKGGYGLILQSGRHSKEESEGFELTTNNRMELLSVIRALELLKRPDCEVTIYSDSKYVVDSVKKGWVFGWVKKNFKGKKNADLWKRFLKIYPKHKVTFEWVKGHAGNPMNERADQLATGALQRENLKIDQGYVDSQNSGSQELF